MRVALVVPSLAEGGGVPGVARFLCRVLEASDRYEPLLVSLAMSSRDEASVRLVDPRSWLRGVQVREGCWEDWSYCHVGAWLAELEFMRYAPRRPLTRLLERADLVHVVAGAPCWALPASLSTTPLLLHVATLTARERRRRDRIGEGARALWRRAMTEITKRLDPVGLRRADRIFVMNRWMQGKAEAVVDPERVIFAPPRVDVDRFRPRQMVRERPEEKYILSVARFADPRKNVELLFRAYTKLSRRGTSPPELRLAGRSGPPKSAWSIARKEGVTHRINYLGEVSEQELARLYQNALFFVLSSDEEGFGLVLAEAMASGIPVISTDCGGPGDIITEGEEGLLVPVGDAVALAGAMARLVDNPSLRQAMGRQARRTAVERYSLRKAGRRFLREYDAVLKGTGPAEGTGRETCEGDVEGEGSG